MISLQSRVEGYPLWPVWILSKGRARTCRLWPELNPTVVIEPHEEAEYREANPGVKFEVLPASNQGICYVRNYILSRNTEGSFWMMDDDLKKFGVTTLGKNRAGLPNYVFRLAQIQMTKSGLDAIGLNYSHLAWSSTSPLKVPDTVQACGAFKSSTMKHFSFDPRYSAGKEDKEISLRMMLEGCRVGRANRLWFDTGSLGGQPGGLQDEYINNRDEDAARLFASDYPGIVTLVKKRTRIDVKINWKKIGK